MSLFRTPLMSPKTRARWGSAVAAQLDGDPNVSRIPTDHAQAYFVENFLTPAQCDTLIAIIDVNRRPSTTLATDRDPGFRTSDSCDMDRWSPAVEPIDNAIADLLGITRENGETMQGQRYAPGQHFRAHHDYFHEGQDYFADVTKLGGQRTWTAMIYLNAVEAGGATWFPQAGFRVEPRPGLLLAWNNMKPDGNPNISTLHEGMAVEAGTKYIVTKWFREGRWLPAA
ncbi:MAG: 2OG-Fe(II) oxygenase [Pseudomonadota bacterium]